MSKNDTISAKEYRAICGKPSAKPKGAKYLQNVGQNQTKPNLKSNSSSQGGDSLEALKIAQSKKVTSENLQAIKGDIDLLVLEGIADAIKRNGLSPAYTDESPNQIKLITTGKSYLITIKEV